MFKAVDLLHGLMSCLKMVIVFLNAHCWVSAGDVAAAMARPRMCKANLKR